MDRYDKAIMYLQEHPYEIFEAWVNPTNHEAGCLFAFVTSTGQNMRGRAPIGYILGCLTRIRKVVCDPGLPYCDQPEYIAETPELTEAIRQDERIPKDERQIGLEHLPVFAEWQRRIDKELRIPYNQQSQSTKEVSCE